MSAVAPHERGGGSLPIVLFLLIGSTLAWLHANRTLLTEVRASTAAARASLALETAEAGIAWSIARLHVPGPIDAGCRPTSAAGTAFADQVLPVALSDPARPRQPAPASPACVLHPGGWQCACPANGAGAPPVPAASDAAAPAFQVHLETGPAPSQWWLQVDGCSDAAAPCLPSLDRSDARHHVRVLLGLLPALPRPPYATVNALGDTQVSGGVQVVNTTPGREWTVATAGRLDADSTARFIGRPGQPGITTTVVGDTRGRSPDGSGPSASRWFSMHFALSPTAYRELPHVHRLPCGSACGAADVTAALDAGHRVLWADGAVNIDTAATLGAAEDPMLLIAMGTLQLTAAATVYGVLHGGSILWDSTTPGLLRGALNSAGPVRLAGPLRLVRDEVVLARLAHAMGSWSRAPGSWNDLTD